MTRKKQERYGFVYIWYDRKHKRYYIGSHWGIENDGYICSSKWMKQAYKHRPLDFKRKILKTNIKSKNEQFFEENKWLSLIKKEEIGKRYYNLHTNTGHWSQTDDGLKNFKEKIKKYVMSEETKEKLRKANIGKIPWNKGIPISEELRNKLKSFKKSEETKKRLSESLKGREVWNKGLPQSEEQKKKHSEFMTGKESWNKGKTGIYTKEQLEKISINSKGRKWYHNPFTKEFILIKEDDIIPEGFIKGRGKFSDETRKKLSESHKKGIKT